MFTPSGYAHIGSLRGPIVHDLVNRSLLDAGKGVHWTYVFNDFDCIDGLPDELMDVSGKYLGFPLRAAPSPFPDFANFGEYFASDFKKVLRDLGIHAEFVSSYDMYQAGKFNDAIRLALDNSELIQDIYQNVSGSQKREKGWLPLQVVCEKCGKLGTTRVHSWNGKTVTYTCEEHMVTWATGCGHTGEMDPFDGRGKLPWKVDWPAHWKVLGVTIEGAGKDHSSAGGSRDIAKELCAKVFNIENPYNLPYEFFLIGGKKMSSSKGLGLKARDLTRVLPPEIGRFLFTRTDYRQAIEFAPVDSMAIPDLFDEYDRCRQSFVDGSDENLGRAFELSQINAIPPKKSIFLPRFRDVANFVQLKNIDIISQFGKVKGSALTDEEKEILKERQKYALVWLELYAPSKYRMQMIGEMPAEAGQITKEQKEFLKTVIALVSEIEDADALQTALYEETKHLGIDTKEAFAGIYLSFLGKKSGPKAAWFLMQYPKEEVISRLTKVTGEHSGHEKKDYTGDIVKTEFFTISEEVKKKYPTVSVGIALIKNVRIGKVLEALEAEKALIKKQYAGLTTEAINAFPEVVSYRKLYRDMKVDWHSRRPSPEALLRRVAQGKELYTINTCVDAYNMVVMRHRVSVGAFDADTIEFPTTLRFPKEGEEILLLGDDTPTKYTETELAYFDGKGGFNLDFNYRDAKRTMVTERTQNIWINVDGIFDITPDMVKKSLKESVQEIIKYCGGTVEFEGVVI